MKIFIYSYYVFVYSFLVSTITLDAFDIFYRSLVYKGGTFHDTLQRRYGGGREVFPMDVEIIT